MADINTIDTVFAKGILNESTHVHGTGSLDPKRGGDG